MKIMFLTLAALCVLVALIISLKIAVLLMVGGIILIGCIGVGTGLTITHINKTCTDDISPLENALWGKENHE